VPNFVAPAFLLGLLFVPVVLWLHFVRRAGRERRVNALWLWTNEVSAAQRARFMPNVLLALQLIGIIAASIGAAGPRLELPGRDLVIILDASASMTAADMGLDVQPVSRLSMATRDAGKLFGTARKILIVRAGLTASVLAGPSSDRQEIRAALERIQAGDSSSDLAGALRLARSLAPNADLHLFTSLGLTNPGPPKNFRGTLHTVRGNGENVGITAFALRGTQAFVALESNLQAPRNATVRLERDGTVVARNTVRVPAGARATWLPKIKVEAGEYKASLENTSDSERFDALELDDNAFAVIGAGRVLIAPPQDDVSRAVVSVPGVRAVTQNLPLGQIDWQTRADHHLGCQCARTAFRLARWRAGQNLEPDRTRNCRWWLDGARSGWNQTIHFSRRWSRRAGRLRCLRPERFGFAPSSRVSGDGFQHPLELLESARQTPRLEVAQRRSQR
jgi:hypothetical protein